MHFQREYLCWKCIGWFILSVSDVSAVWDYSADTDGIVGNSAPESNEGATGDANPKWA